MSHSSFAFISLCGFGQAFKHNILTEKEKKQGGFYFLTGRHQWVGLKRMAILSPKKDGP